MKDNEKYELSRLFALYIKKSKRYVRLIGKASSKTLERFYNRIMRLSETINTKYQEIYQRDNQFRKRFGDF